MRISQLKMCTAKCLRKIVPSSERGLNMKAHHFAKPIFKHFCAVSFARKIKRNHAYIQAIQNIKVNVVAYDNRR